MSAPLALSQPSPRVDRSPSAASATRPAAGTLDRLRREAAAVAALVVLAVLAALAVAAPVVGGHDPLLQDRASRFEPPWVRHLFGTDEFGRDIWSRVVHGARVSLVTGAAVVDMAVLEQVSLEK